jgi:hypothetical protein
MLLAYNIHKFGEPFVHFIVGLFISIFYIHMVNLFYWFENSGHEMATMFISSQ